MKQRWKQKQIKKKGENIPVNESPKTCKPQRNFIEDARPGRDMFFSTSKREESLAKHHFKKNNVLIPQDSTFHSQTPVNSFRPVKWLCQAANVGQWTKCFGARQEIHGKCAFT